MASEDICALTDHGFRWGNTEVVRYARLPEGHRVIGIEVDGERRIEVYVSPAGRTVRVFDKKRGELTPDDR